MAKDPNRFYVLWFDPGGTTGWAVFVVSRKAYSRPERDWRDWVLYWNYGEFSGPEHEVMKKGVELIRRVRDKAGMFNCHIGGEAFDKTLTPGSEQNLFSPVRINAVLDWECYRIGIKYQYQSRTARLQVTQERLEAWGFNRVYLKGSKGDAFAATQHAVTHIRRLKRESERSPWKLNTPDIVNAQWDCACTGRKKCDLIHLR